MMTVRSRRVCVSVTSSVGRRATDQRAIGIAIAIAGVREVGPRGMFVQMSVFHRFLVHACVHVHEHRTTHPPLHVTTCRTLPYTWIASLVEAGGGLSV